MGACSDQRQVQLLDCQGAARQAAQARRCITGLCSSGCARSCIERAASGHCADSQ